jgi:hypothetical protein
MHMHQESSSHLGLLQVKCDASEGGGVSRESKCQCVTEFVPCLYDVEEVEVA